VRARQLFVSRIKHKNIFCVYLNYETVILLLPWC